MKRNPVDWMVQGAGQGDPTPAGTAGITGRIAVAPLFRTAFRRPSGRRCTGIANPIRATRAFNTNGGQSPTRCLTAMMFPNSCGS